jgi:hypothetical protein
MAALTRAPDGTIYEVHYLCPRCRTPYPNNAFLVAADVDPQLHAGFSAWGNECVDADTPWCQCMPIGTPCGWEGPGRDLVRELIPANPWDVEQEQRRWRKRQKQALATQKTARDAAGQAEAIL